MEKESLGLIETLGLVAAIEAADAGSKAANVVFRGCGRARAGLITVVFAGDVAAVRAAVSAASAAARRIGTVVSEHVIARPDRQVRVSSNGTRASQQGIAPCEPKIEERIPIAPAQESEAAPIEVPAADEVLRIVEAETSEPVVEADNEAAVAIGLAPSFTAEPEVESARQVERLPVTVVTLLEDEIMADVSAGNGYPVVEDEAEVAVAVPAGRKKEKVRKTKSKRKS